jgi:hypothetical protein
MGLSTILEIAGPESTGCVATAKTRFAPFLSGPAISRIVESRIEKLWVARQVRIDGLIDQGGFEVAINYMNLDADFIKYFLDQGGSVLGFPHGGGCTDHKIVYLI